MNLQTLLEQLTPDQKKLFDKVKPIIEEANQLPWFIQNPNALTDMLKRLETLPAARDNHSMLHGLIKAIIAEKATVAEKIVSRNTIFYQAEVTVTKENNENKKPTSSSDQSLKTPSSTPKKR